MPGYHRLSKSTFLKGHQCQKALYLLKYRPELVPEVTKQLQAIFDQGTDVGVLAQQLFPGGTDAGIYIPENFGASLKLTKDLIARGKKVIYEAGFSAKRMHCFVDILVKEGDAWHAYEVKSTTGVKEVHHWDAAFQYYVLTQAGVEVSGFSMIVLNTDYERIGELDIRQLFKIEPVLDKILPMQAEIERQVGESLKMLDAGIEPEVDIGTHCHEPYECEFIEHCWKHVPEHSVFEIANNRGKAWDLYKKGILEFRDIPEDFPLNGKQWQQVLAELKGEVHIDKEAIREFISKLKYPLYFLDFETFQAAVPMFDNSRPYQQIPFQYSLHVLKEKGGEVEHREFLAEAGGKSQTPISKFQTNSKSQIPNPKHEDANGQTRLEFPEEGEGISEPQEPDKITRNPDPRTGFIESLITHIGPEGDIVVFNRQFESMILGQLIRDFPQYGEQLKPLQERLVDLMDPFRKREYYVPEMRGSYSIKKVLPALVPGFSYDDMDIADGAMASMAFRSLYREEDREVIKRTRKHLLEYCKLDTLAMVEILRVLEEAV